MDIEEICNIDYDYLSVANNVFVNTLRCQNNTIEINGSCSTVKNQSYILMNKENVNISLSDLNHLVVRNCKNCNIIVNSSVSGIDLLYCSDIRLYTNISYLELWGCSNIKLYFPMYQKIIVSYSLDIFFNDTNINTNLFSRRHFPDTLEERNTIQTYIYV